MATTFNEGERVQVVDREANAEDVKSGLFYNHFRGLTGTVQKIYATQEAVVDVEQESMTEAIVKRHIEVQEAMKAKWLDGLSEEAKSRLTESEKDFRLRYSLLVHVNDLKAPDAAAIPVGTRATLAEIEAKEQAYLATRQPAIAAAPSP